MKTLYQWERQAACKGMDVGLFFDHEEDQSEPAPEALAACARCPVRDSCLDEALRFEPFGVRGGFTAGGSIGLPSTVQCPASFDGGPFRLFAGSSCPVISC